MATRHVQDFEVQKELESILEQADLTVLSRKQVRKQLAAKFGGSFSTPEWKARIKQQIEEFVQRREAGVNTVNHPHPTRVDKPKPPKPNGTIIGPPPKRRRVDSEDQDYFPSTHRSQLRAAQNGNVYSSNEASSYYDERRRPKLQSNKQLIQQNPQDNSYFIKLGDCMSGQKRCVIHTFKRKVYVGFREYYQDKRSGDMKPTKKGINLDMEQWDMICRNIDAINKQIKSMR